MSAFGMTVFGNVVLDVAVPVEEVLDDHQIEAASEVLDELRGLLEGAAITWLQERRPTWRVTDAS